MTNEELLTLIEKAAITTAAGGQLPPEAASQFIDTVVSQNEALQKLNVIKMSSATYRLDTLGVASRLMRKATEASEPVDTKGISIGSRQLAYNEVILPYDISFNFLESNLEKDNAEDSINRVFATQFGNDLLDLAINGDEASADDFIKINDGWLKISGADSGIHPVTIAASPTFKTVFKDMLSAMPNKWKRNYADLVFLVAPDVEVTYRNELADRATALGDAYLTEGRRAQYQGVDVYPLPYLPGSAAPQCVLTTWKNLAVGIGRQIRVGKQIQERKRIMEYTITAKVDFNYVLSDMIVLAKKAS
jgi:hypothetical protein